MCKGCVAIDIGNEFILPEGGLKLLGGGGGGRARTRLAIEGDGHQGREREVEGLEVGFVELNKVRLKRINIIMIEMAGIQGLIGGG